MIKELKALFDRDLIRLADEIKKFESEDQLWKTVPGIKNSSGNLTLHLCGNLRHFIAHILAKSDYSRDRDFEFNGSGLSRTQLLKRIAEARKEVVVSLDNLDQRVFDQFYPIEVFGYPMSVSYFLIHLQGHLNYHLGQINYLRRILTNP